MSFKKKLKKRLKGLSLRRNDIFVRNMVLVLGAVFIWRGVWNILDHYFFPHDRVVSNLLSIVFGIFLVFLLDEEIKHERTELDEKRRKQKKHKEKDIVPFPQTPSKKTGNIFE